MLMTNSSGPAVSSKFASRRVMGAAGAAEVVSIRPTLVGGRFAGVRSPLSLKAITIK